MNAPTVSVVVPAFNQSGYLAEALTSALAQSMTDLEVVVVDDGSTDQTRELCASFKDPRLRYVYQPNDGTMGVGARNHAMLLARGDWIAPLDQDDRWAPQKLQRQMAAVKQRDTVGAVFCRVRFIDAAGEPQGEQVGPLPEGDVLHLLLRANRYYVSSGMFRRSLLPMMGMPHEAVAIGDWYLWVSVSRHAQVLAINDVLADYRLHPAGFQVAQRGSNEFRFWQDHWRFAQAVAPRAHRDCLLCRQALFDLRRFISGEQFAAARDALRRGEFSSDVADAVRCSWAAEPNRFDPKVTIQRLAQLARAAAAGGWVRISLRS